MPNPWQETVLYAQAMRRKLHAQPELSWQEHQTAQAVRHELDQLGIPWRPCAGTGTVAWLNHGVADPVAGAIALRGDMDALPIAEQTGKAWQSQNPGCMHACGHDGHTATLLATARWLKLHEAQLSRPVVLLFQPAEEGFHGAREMIRDGALEGVDEIYGWHNWPAMPYGTMACPDQVVMCGNGTFTIELLGRGGHSSQPEACADPVLAGSAVVLALQQIVSHRLSPQTNAVVSLTQFNAGSATNVIPETAQLAGSIRVPNETTRERIKQLITEVAGQTAAAYGVQCNVVHEPRYQATINHPAQAANARNLWSELYGAHSLEHGQAMPLMASEDFSYFLQEIPGAFALIGSDDGAGHHVPCHSPHYDFNDRLIADVCRWFSRLVGLDTFPPLC